MLLRSHSYGERAGERLFRLLASRFAELQIIVHRFVKCAFHFPGRIALKGDHISRIDHFSTKGPRLLIELHNRFVSLVCHGFPSGVMSASTRKRRMAATVPRSVSPVPDVAGETQRVPHSTQFGPATLGPRSIQRRMIAASPRSPARRYSLVLQIPLRACARAGSSPV